MWWNLLLQAKRRSKTVRGVLLIAFYNWEVLIIKALQLSCCPVNVGVSSEQEELSSGSPVFPAIITVYYC